MRDFDIFYDRQLAEVETFRTGEISKPEFIASNELLFGLFVSLVREAYFKASLPPQTTLSCCRDEMPSHCHDTVLLNTICELPPR